MPTGGSILLSEVAQHLTSVDISCNFCERRRKANIAPTCRSDAATDFPRRQAERIAEPCGVHLPGLADVFGTKGSVAL